MREFTVTFKKQGKPVKVPRGTDLLRAARKAGAALAAPCNGEGVCGKCRVIIEKGDVNTDASCTAGYDPLEKGLVLACRTLVESDLEISIPEDSLEPAGPISYKTEDSAKGIILKREKEFTFSPIVKKIHIDVKAQEVFDSARLSDDVKNRLKNMAGGIEISTKIFDSIAHKKDLRAAGHGITATLVFTDALAELLSVEPGDTSGANFAFAFDIGTTTIAGQLIDLKRDQIVGSRIVFNKQAVYGADVITRIVCASESDGMERLNSAVIGNINEIIEDLSASHKVSLSDVFAIVLAGNMTMMHLLLKIDPSGMRKAPYMPETSAFPAASAANLEIEINPCGVVVSIPGVSTYIGGDIVSGILACGLSDSEELTLLVDIGTNGEIVLGNREWMIGSAASAGPAFEGSGLSCGMKAASGAIQKVSIDANNDVRYETISGASPKGICGSGYIDLLCQLLRRGIIDKDGRINRNTISRRVRMAGNNYEFVVAFSSETDIGRDIVIQDDDIDNLKRSKGAIYSAIVGILKKVGKDISEVKKIYIAGGFGNYLNIENSIFIGLLPDIDRSIYEFIGNSSLAGARMSLVSREAFDKIESIYKNITYLDLGSEPDYMDEYVAALFFPHTDIGRFPSVRL